MGSRVRVEFTLSMPSVNSWNGRWSGEGRHYAIVRTTTRAASDALLGATGERYWSYNFGDGWRAGVSARVVPPGERPRKSVGFAGYDWMVDSILADGAIYGPTQPKPAPEVHEPPPFPPGFKVA